MYGLKKFKVELINKEEVKDFVKKHGEFATICYSSDTKYAEQIGRSCLHSGHLSGSRGDYFKFKITNVPRDMIDQLIRSEEGCYKNVQSFRYVNKDNFKIYAPPEVLNDEELFNTFYNLEMFANKFYSEAIDRLNELGYTGEKANQIARHLLPIGTESAVMIGFDIEGLIHLANIRLCTRAELPIRRITQMMIDEVKKVTHEYDDLLVCKCDRDLFCVEDKCCGRKPTKEELKNKLNNIPHKYGEVRQDQLEYLKSKYLYDDDPIEYLDVRVPFYYKDVKYQSMDIKDYISMVEEIERREELKVLEILKKRNKLNN